MPLNAVPAGARAVPVAIGHLLLRHAEARPHLVPNAADPPDAGGSGGTSALVAATRRAPTTTTAQRCGSTRRRPSPAATRHLLLRHAEPPPHLVPNAADPPDAGPPRQQLGTCCCDTPSPHRNNRPTLQIHQTQALPGSNSALVATTRRVPTTTTAQKLHFSAARNPEYPPTQARYLKCQPLP